MKDAPLPRYNRKTTLRVKVVDRAANIGITIGGLGVILAVAGLIAFIAWQVFPLFMPADIGPATDPIKLEAGRTLLLHTDEYRRVGVRIATDGTVTVFAVPTGEVISQAKPAELDGAEVTAAHATLQPRTQRMVGNSMGVPHYHVLLGTSDGRVLVGEIGYTSEFLRFGLDEEPSELAALAMPSEDAYRRTDYVPEILVRDGKVVEHQVSFGLYRATAAHVNWLRSLDVNTSGSAIQIVAGQLSEGTEDDSRTSVSLVVTRDGRTRLVRETIEVNMFTGDSDVSTDTRDLTSELHSVPDWALVNELQDALILASRGGRVHHFQRDPESDAFVQPHRPVNVFAAQSDPERGRDWRAQVNEMRLDAGLEEIPQPPELTAVSFLLGDDTLVFGDTHGGLQSWLTVQEEDLATGRVWKRFVRVRTLPVCEGPIISLAASPITKAILIVDSTGQVRAVNNTARRLYAEFKVDGGTMAVFNRKGDAVLAATDAGDVHHWWIDAPHSEVSWSFLFGEVWYESFPEPQYVWQSAGGTDDVEPKLSMVPLIVGTIKGALYALLFAVPLAVLAAIYTSEFMHRNMRAVLKPTMEVMASLPSVVLGFLAALYFAPKAAPIMPTLLCMVVIVPAVFLVFGWVWQRCPPSLVGKFGYWRSTALLFALLALGTWISSMVGPRAEVFLFPTVEGTNPALIDAQTFQPVNEQIAEKLDAGDFRTWTGGGAELAREQEAGGKVLPKGWWIPGGHNLFIALMAIPLTLLLGWGVRAGTRAFNRRGGTTPVAALRARLEGGNPAGFRALGVDVGFSLVLGGVLVAAGTGLSFLVSPVLESLLFSYDHPTAGSVADFRRWVTGPEGWKFEQANSLVVGFAMGFAVIPLIYTISEDALTTVPNQLRAASLACGASRWQTTMRIVLPAAASGIFSAIVIGLGRALGETMIVVMAAGGTAVMDLQPLSGFRSLSLSIATEMPEAPHGGTLYRTLFLAGLVLFLMAFSINTLAEVVRMRLRRKLSRL